MIDFAIGFQGGDDDEVKLEAWSYSGDRSMEGGRVNQGKRKGKGKKRRKKD